MYATTTELYLAIEPLLPPNSDETAVNSAWAEMAVGDVDTELLMEGITTPAVDRNNLLKLAQICYYMDISKSTRQIEFVTGEVQQEMSGKYRKRYTNSMPMFFFSQGSSRPFFQLLPTETFRMRGYKYLQAYVRAYFQEKYKRNYVRTIVMQDTTSRGYGWENEIVDETEWRNDPWGGI